MSGSLFNRGGFHAQGTEMHGKGISEEQVSFGTTVSANGTSGTPVALAKTAGLAVTAQTIALKVATVKAAAPKPAILK